MKRRLNIFLFLALVVLTWGCKEKIDTGNPEDRAALTALYNATGGPGWSIQTDWNTPAPLSEWYGVSLNSDGRVKSIHLDNNSLQGSVPSEIGRLAHLQWLGLSSNELHGEIPAAIGDLKRLEWLDLSENAITGKIPPEIGNIDSLKFLFLGNNGLGGEIPASFAKLGKLVTLDLGSNDLGGSIPEFISGLHRLDGLILEYNRFTGTMPLSLPRNLGILRLDGNRLSGPIPDATGNLVYLEILSLQDNELTGGLPVSMGGLRELETLQLQGNKLEGTIPEGLKNNPDYISWKIRGWLEQQAGFGLDE